MTQTHYIPIGSGAGAAKERIRRSLEALTEHCPWVVMITEKKPSRSLAQNATLWALYDDIIRRGGEMMAGWENKDLHQFFLGEWGGWQELHGMKRTRLKPLRRSSRLNKTEFSEFLEFIVRYMAQQGVVLELPGV
jgi:hypothetical protein